MRRAKILVILVVLWLAAAPAQAKKRKSIGAPELDWSMPWLALGYSVATLAGICVVGFKNSRRTHLD